MANEVLIKDATATTWTSSGGDKAITLTSLANTAGRVGASLDLGTPRARRVVITLQVKFGTAPTDGTTVDLYLIRSNDNSIWDGNITPSDAALSSADTLRNLFYVGSLVCDNLTTTQVQSFLVEIGQRYVAPVVYNNGTGQALSSTGTDHKVIITPIKDEIQ